MKKSEILFFISTPTETLLTKFPIGNFVNKVSAIRSLYIFSSTGMPRILRPFLRTIEVARVRTRRSASLELPIILFWV